MNSSGIKRGLAATAISALAVTGLPFLANTASATPIEDTLAPNAVELYVPEDTIGISDENDGTNTTVSLVAGGGENVTSVLFQYSTDNGTTWVNVPGGNVARTADGVFQVDWSNPPTTVTDVRAVPNTGLGFADSANTAYVPAAAAQTVELATEGNLGVFQAPYTTEAVTGDYLAVTGTVSDGTGSVTVWDVSHGTAGNTAMNVDPDSDTFEGVLDIEGYPYSPGSEPNQIALAAFTDATITEDAEGSTLYVQTIGSITATPETQEDATPGDAEVTLTVLDTQGQPVANAQVGLADLDTDGAGPDTDGPDTIVGYTDGNGQITDVPGGVGTHTYYVNTTDNDEYEPGTDPSDTATITTYTPALASVDIVNDRNRSNFDLDEFLDSDDFTIVTKDQRGNTIDENLVGADVEYRWVVDPSGTGDTVTSPWIPAETAANGEFQVPGPTDGDIAVWTTGGTTQLPEGTYTLEARRPNVNGSGLTNATPETVTASESEITFDEGGSANAPVNGTYTVEGNLANDNGGLGGREIQITYTPTGDSTLAPTAQQPAGVTVTGNTATAVTDANGDFSLVLNDPDVPDNVTPTPEDGTIHAIAEEAANDNTSLQGNNGPNDSTTADDPDNAEAEIDVHFDEQEDADEIVLTEPVEVLAPTYEYQGNDGGPGVPVDIDFRVEDENNNVLTDYPVEVTIDAGFLTDDAESADDLNLAEGHDETGDLFGYFENNGASQTVNTGDAGNEGGVVAAIERHEGFDDDGFVDATVTLTAGDQTLTVPIQWDVRWLLNVSSVDLEANPSGEVPVSQDSELQLYVYDQFDNLAGDTWADISDDSTIADFETDEDGDTTESDFTTDAPGIRAFSDAPATQTITARINESRTTVTTEGNDPVWASQNYTGDETIEWVEGVKENAGLTLRGGDNGAADDSLFANAVNDTAGAEVSLFRKRADGSWKKIRTAVMNDKGNYRFKNVNDRNGNKITRYKAVVQPTDETRKGVGKKKVR